MKKHGWKTLSCEKVCFWNLFESSFRIILRIKLKILQLHFLFQKHSCLELISVGEKYIIDTSGRIRVSSLTRIDHFLELLIQREIMYYQVFYQRNILLPKVRYCCFYEEHKCRNIAPVAFWVKPLTSWLKPFHQWKTWNSFVVNKLHITSLSSSSHPVFI